MFHSPLTRTSIVKAIGGFDEDFRNYCADWEIWLTLSWQGYLFYKIPEVLSIYRRHSTSLTRATVYPNTLGELSVLMRALAYSKSCGCIEISKINESLRSHYERSTYWAVIDVNWKKAYAHVLTSLQYVPNNQKAKQWLRGIGIIMKSTVIKEINRYPRFASFQRRCRKKFKAHFNDHFL